MKKPNLFDWMCYKKLLKLYVTPIKYQFIPHILLFT